MTRETAKRMIKGHPLARQAVAKKDIEERAYCTEELVPVFELDGNSFQFTALYRFRAQDGEYVFGRAMSLSELCSMQQQAAAGEVFRIVYLKSSRIIVEIEERDP